ncbi:endonuclease/exonuclease/phosphatase family protein [Aquincola sp. MAHUQ-54]|uniref:Endonuclease/exonuclease/phosphatase family protein n=1 Tax=Aquincola agrisoli TaxID=3119538 RepID=A0AAW9QKP3_9BURK
MQLITWNTQWCRGLDGTVSPERIVAAARAMADFDVLCLQEIAQGLEALPGRPGDQPAEIAALLPGFRVFFGAAWHDPRPDGDDQRFGNLVATRLPVVHVQHHPLPWPADPSAATLPRMCTVVTLCDPQLGAVRVMTAHLEYGSAVQRLAQAHALHDLHAEACARAAAPHRPPSPDRPPPRARVHTAEAILCGDFNAPPASPELEAIRSAAGPARLHDAWPIVHPGRPPAPTFALYDTTYAPAPVAFDHVLVSGGLAGRVADLQVDAATRASDHQPLRLTLR